MKNKTFFLAIVYGTVLLSSLFFAIGAFVFCLFCGRDKLGTKVVWLGNFGTL